MGYPAVNALALVPCNRNEETKIKHEPQSDDLEDSSVHRFHCTVARARQDYGSRTNDSRAWGARIGPFPSAYRPTEIWSGAHPENIQAICQCITTDDEFFD